MTLVLFSWVANQQYFKDLMDQDLRLKMYSQRIKEMEDDITPFGFISNGFDPEIEVDTVGQIWKRVSQDEQTSLVGIS